MIVVVMGVSGSGKTTVGERLATELGWDFADADSFHSPENRAKMRAGVPLTDSDREPWLRSLRRSVKGWLDDGRNVVLACSALKESYRRAIAREDEPIRFVFLRGSYEVIKGRLQKRRQHFMDPDLLGSQFETLEEPERAMVIDVDQSPEEIVDEITARLGPDASDGKGPGDRAGSS